MTYPQEVFTAFSFLGFLLAAIPLPWHFEAWNTGTCLYMFWTSLGCLNFFINSIVWRGHAVDVAPAWCEISSRIIVANYIAIAASSLCIVRRLYIIASVRAVVTTKAEKRRDVVVDLSIGLGIPLVFQVFYYINQGHRYNIYEDLGCWPFVYNTWVAYLLIACPPIIVGSLSAYYAIRSILILNKSRASFKENLSSHSNLTSSRYFRLMMLAGTEILGTLPVLFVVLYFNVTTVKLMPWISWEDTHSFFDRVDQYPGLLWRSNPRGAFQLELSRYLTLICSFLFFGFFGFADEARKHYRLAFQSITKTLGISTTFTGTSSSGMLSSDGGLKSRFGSTGKVRPSVPIHVHKEMFRRPNSMGSDISVSLGDVGGFLTEPKNYEKDDEKLSQFAPTLSYGAMTLNDVASTLPDYSESPNTPTSDTTTASPTTPGITQQNLHRDLEISSLRRESAVLSPTVDATTAQKARTHDIV